MRHLRAAVAVFIVAALAASARADDAADRALLAGVAASEADATAAWDALPAVDRVRILRAGLLGESEVAAFAAREASPWDLDLGELARQFRILAAQSEWDGDAACIGGAEVVPAWRTLPPDVLVGGEAHRVTRVGDVPALVTLASERADLRAAIHDDLRIVAQCTDRHRAALARAFRDDLSARDGADPPPTPPAGSGLPADFVALAHARWGLEGLNTLQREARSSVPGWWLLRWRAELTPTAADVAFIERVADTSPDRDARVWALRHLARLRAGGSVAWLLARVPDDELPDPDVAAVLALAGERSAWERLRAARPVTRDEPLAWELAPESARAAWADDPAALTRSRRAELRFEYGVDVTDADVARLAAELPRSPDGLAAALRAYATCASEGLRGETLAQFARALATRDGAEACAALREDDVRVVLGLLELRAPDALDAVTRAWLEQGGDVGALAASARLRAGLATDVRTLFALWRGAPRGRPWDDAWVVGLADGEEVADRLRAVAEGEGEFASAAVQALAARSGPDGGACDWLTPPDDDWTVTPWDAARAAVLAGRPHAAADGLLDAGVADPHLVSALSDERLAALRGQRNDGAYWPATLALALRGDSAARAELDRALAENRTPLLDPLQFDTDPRRARFLAARHIERLEHNCCAAFQARVALRALFATIPLDEHWNPVEVESDVAAAWLRENEAHLAWSAVAETWLVR